MIVYKATNLVNNKIYIGLTTGMLNDRKSKHKYDAENKNSNSVFHKAIRKYGWDNFKWEVIDRTRSKRKLVEKEIYWISQYDSLIENGNGYNMTLGGDGRLGSNGHFGESHPNATLTEQDIVEIKYLLVQGFNCAEIAKKFNVDRTNISSIANEKTWGHIEVDNWSQFVNMGKRGRKLCESKAVKIKDLLVAGVPRKEIASQFNVNVRTIARIATGDAWETVYVEGWDKYLEKKGLA